jgi:prevent-host-death family protein
MAVRGAAGKERAPLSEANLAEDFYPITEVQNSVRRIVDRAAETGRPMVITQKGRPVAAVVEIGELERLRRLADLAEDYRAFIVGMDGPGIPHEVVMEEMKEEIRTIREAREVEGGAAAAAP